MRIQLSIVLGITLVVTTITVAGEFQDFDSQDGKHGTDMKKRRHAGQCPRCPLGYVCCVTVFFSYVCCLLPTTTTRRPIATTLRRTTTTTRRPTTTRTSIRPSQNSWARSEVKFEKYAVVTCGKRHHSVLSCGISNGRYEPTEYQLAFPRNKTACACRSTREAKCVAWCAFIVSNWHVVSGRCSSNTKVVSCHPGNSNVRDLNFHPSPDGSSCICTNYGQCLATCASVEYYEIRKVTGSGKITVKCPPMKGLLGCGFQTLHNYVYDRLQSAHVSAENREMVCECYCKSPNTCVCYAICGHLDWTLTNKNNRGTFRLLDILLKLIFIVSRHIFETTLDRFSNRTQRDS